MCRAIDDEQKLNAKHGNEGKCSTKGMPGNTIDVMSKSWMRLTDRKYQDYIYKKMLVQEYLKK